VEDEEDSMLLGGTALFLVVDRLDGEAAAKEEPRFLGTIVCIVWKGATR